MACLGTRKEARMAATWGEGWKVKLERQPGLGHEGFVDLGRGWVLFPTGFAIVFQFLLFQKSTQWM